MNVTDFVGNGASGGGGLKIAGAGIFNSSAGANVQGVTVTRGFTANTYGSWSQLIAAAAEDDYLLGVCVLHDLFTAQRRTVSLGVGGAGSEVQIAEFKLGIAPVAINTDSTQYCMGPGVLWLPYPILIASGARLAARWAGAAASSSATMDISALLCKKTDLVAQ